MSAKTEISPPRLADRAALFAALGDETRLTLLAKLSSGRVQSISSLAADSRLTRQALTKHLHVLERAGLARCRRVGREARYVFQPKPIDEARRYLERVARQWDEALDRLKSFVEDGA